MRVEDPSGEHTRPHGAEVVRRHRCADRRSRSPSCARWPRRRRRAAAAPLPVSGSCDVKPDVRDARNRPQPRSMLVARTHAGPRASAARREGRRRGTSAPLVLEPGLHLLQPDEAAHHQAGADEQDERQRDFAPSREHCAAELHGCRRERRARAQRTIEILTRRGRSAGTMPEQKRRQRADGQREAPGRWHRSEWPSMRGRLAGSIAAQHAQAAFRQHQPQDPPPPPARGFRSRAAGRGASRRRRAPSAAPSRAAAPSTRASSRFATLAQAMSSTNTTGAEERDERRLGVLDDVVLERNDADAHVGRSRARRAPAGAAGRCRPSRPAPARTSRPA